MKSKRTRNFLGCCFALLLTVSLGVASAQPGVQQAPRVKYVFYFIGDGMGVAHVQAAHAYRAVRNGGDPNDAAKIGLEGDLLHMHRFPVVGLSTTYAANSFITDSAAAGTALATGSKTRFGTLGKSADLATSYKTIAQMAQEQGRAVGIVTSVSLNHATPAAFYAKADTRTAYEQIAIQAAQSGFDFFGGGGWLRPTHAAYAEAGAGASEHLVDLFRQNGYALLNETEAIRSLKDAPLSKVAASVPDLAAGASMAYEIDRAQGEISLADITEIAIRCLYANDAKDGFFLMVEGGKIDWASHANDPMGVVGDVLAFDEAIGKALDFYRQHPEDTLIVVTADHETGGLALGFAGRGYSSSFEQLLKQKISHQQFTRLVAAYKEKRGFPDAYQPQQHTMSDEFKELIAEHFGLVYDGLSAYRQQRLQAAYARSMSGQSGSGAGAPSGYTGRGARDRIDYLEYGNYEAIVAEVCHQLAKEAGLDWTTFVHTAVPVPVLAIGPGSERLAGFYTNTAIPKAIAKAMGIEEELPVPLQ